MQRKNKKILGAVQTRAYPLRSSTPMPSAAPSLLHERGAHVGLEKEAKNYGGFNPVSVGYASAGPDDLGHAHYGKYLRCTLTQEQAEQECLDGLKRSVLAGYVVMVAVLFTIGGLTAWVLLFR